MMIWVMILLFVIAAIVGGLLLIPVLARIWPEGNQAKTKRHEEDGASVRLEALGEVWPDDETDLPELSEDDLFLHDKPKRSE